MSEKTMLFRLRDRARTEPNELTRFNLKDTADKLATSIAAFVEGGSEDALREMTGLWARGRRLLSFASEPPKGGGGGKLREGARRAA